MKSLKVLAVALGLACATAAHADDTVRIMAPVWTGFAPVVVAQELGYFRDAHLSVDLKFSDERSDVMAAMAHGSIELEMRALNEYQGRPRDENTPGIIIGSIDRSLGGDGVIVDGSIHDVTDLKGKTVASESNIPGRLLLQMELHKHGMTLADLKMKEILTSDSVAVFADPSIAAVVTYQPFLQQIMTISSSRQPKELVSSADYPDYIVDVIVARNDDLKANPDKYKRFLTCIYKAVAYYKSNPDDFAKLAAPHFDLSADEFKKSVVGSLEYTDLAQSKTYMGTPGKPGKMVDIFNTLMGLNIENGAASVHLDAARSIDSSLIAAISIP
ncbi:ABC transporter substrate-binding protein [Acetobacter conturbans]|uniref:Myristoyl transferase n=1 Tax=Acetobacter conturbans TaxID=1737472 RepID=A0ABX0K2P8_9PROT|nr:ABC transporter substrate-binding protein [Acetobacter conturbans]NHN89535.1 myristoyl transferase [Acetobacter conturbans]